MLSRQKQQLEPAKALQEATDYGISRMHTAAGDGLGGFEDYRPLWISRHAVC
jgi:hypothetical protein